MRPVPSSEAMDACCAATVRRQQRYVLQLVLAVNATMFCVEFGAGLIARSTALLGDSLDMLGDTLVYAFSLYVLNKDRAWRARSALIKGGVMLAFGVGVFVTAIVRLQAGGIPLVPAMMGIGALALVANAFCFALLWRHRTLRPESQVHMALLPQRSGGQRRGHRGGDVSRSAPQRVA